MSCFGQNKINSDSKSNVSDTFFFCFIGMVAVRTNVMITVEIFPFGPQ